MAVAHDPQGRPSDGEDGDLAPRFDSKFSLDLDMDGFPEVIAFNKPPLELAATSLDTGTALRLIGVHAKSKAPHGARNDREMAELSIANRREHLAQCIWMRRRVDALLDARQSLVVLGDFNDGPGLDGYEKLFGRSGLEVVLGDPALPDRYLIEPHARIRLDPRQGWALSTSRFYNAEHKRYINALLDYVMLSPDLAASAAPHWRIWHPFDDPACFSDRDLREALLTASDHFPVSVDLQI
jgi:endonuclease/exonuclease/phosphatase family metal-dependent hydrolase